MVEELRQTDAQVLAVAALAQVVRFVVVLQHPGLFAQTAETVVEFDALPPRHGAVGVVVHDQHGCRHVGHVEQRGVLHIEVEAFPEVLADTALAFLILAGTGDAALPADAAVGAGHVAHRSAGTGRLEAVGLGDQVGHLVTAPALALDGHVVPIDPRVLAEHVHTRHQALEAALARMSVGIDQVGDKDQIAVAHEIRDIDGRSARGRDAAVVEGLGVALVEVDHHRIFLLGIEIFRLEEQAFERLAVGAGPADELDRAPVVVALLRVDVAHLLLGLEVVGRLPDVVAVFEAAAGIEQRTAFLAGRNRHIAEGIRAFIEFLEFRLLLAEVLDGEAMLLGYVIEGREIHRLVGLDGTAAERAAGLGIVVRAGIVVGRLRLAADALGHAERRNGSGRVELPEIVLVRDPEESGIIRPHRPAPGTRIGRMVVLFIPEGHAQLGGQFLELARGQGVEIPVVFLRMEGHGISAVGRDGPAAERRILADEFTLAVFERQLVHIVVGRIAPAALDAVGFVGGHDDIILRVLLVDGDIGNLLVGQLDEAAAVIVHLRQIGLRQVAAQVVLLHGLDVLVVPDPDVELRLFEVHEGRIFLTRDRAGTQRQEILVEIHGTLVADLPAFRELGGIVREDLAGRAALIEIKVEALLGILGRVERAEEGQAVGFIVEHEALEGRFLFTRKDFAHRLGGRIVEENAADVHAVLLVRFGHIGDAVAFLRDDVRLDTFQRIDGQRLDIEYIKIILRRFGSRFLRIFLLLFTFFHLFVFRIRLRRGFLGFLESDIVAQGLTGLETLHQGIFLNPARGQVEDAEAVLGHLGRFLLVDLRLARLLELGRDAEDDLAGVCRNLRKRGAFDVVGFAGLHVVKMQHEVAFLRCDGPLGPVAVVLHQESAHTFPAVIDRVVKRRFCGKTA